MSQTVLVCGGRDFDNWLQVDHVLCAELSEGDTLICGGARGADWLAFEFALDQGLFFVVFPADWARFGKRAGYLRNRRMLDEGRPDRVIAFAGGRGTTMMCEISKHIQVLQVPR